MHLDQLKRRDFITLLGGAVAAWPRAVRAQQPKIPVIGFLSSGSQQSDVWRLVEFRRGLSETGYVDGRNVMSQFRWADEQYDRLPALATELARSRPAVIVAVGGPAAALAAKAASTTIPIVFAIAGDPVKPWPRRKRQSTGWQRDRRKHRIQQRGGKAARNTARDVAQGNADRLSREPEESECRNGHERGAGGCAHPRATSPIRERRHRT